MDSTYDPRSAPVRTPPDAMHVPYSKYSRFYCCGRSVAPFLNRKSVDSPKGMARFVNASVS
eukprot:1296427-Prymnesium_polylepis.1